MKNIGTAFVLNLRRRPDRLEHFFGCAPECFEYIATDNWPQLHDGQQLSIGTFATELEELQLFNWKTTGDFEWWARPLKWGEVGCTIGHWKIWQRAYEMNLPEVYIFEDDALLPDDLPEKIELLNRDMDSLSLPCDLFYLGRVIEGIDKPVTSNLVKPGFSHCTYGYRLSNAGLKILLSTNLLGNVIPIDEFLPAMYMRHPREDVAKVFPPRISALAAYPEIVAQRKKSDAGSDTEDSEFVT